MCRHCTPAATQQLEEADLIFHWSDGWARSSENSMYLGVAVAHMRILLQ